MTLNEAIRHCEEVAEEQDKLCKRYDDASGYSRSNNKAIRVADAKRCEECAAEHRQLAEWLEELKQLRKRQSDLDKIRTEIDGLLNDEDNSMYTYGVMDCLEIIDKYKKESEDNK